MFSKKNLNLDPNKRWRFSIGWRMALGFGVFTIAVSGLFLQTRAMLNKSRELGIHIDKIIVPSLGALENIDRSVGESRIKIKHWLTVQSRSDDPHKRDLVELIKETIPNQYYALKSMEGTWGVEAQIQLDSLQNDLDYLFIAYGEIMRLLPDFASYDDPIALMEAEYYALEGSSLPLFTKQIRKRLDRLTGFQNSSLRASTNAMEELGDKLNTFAGTVAFLIIIFGIVVGLAVTRSILVPVKQLKRAVLYMGQGKKLDYSVPITPDEIGDMALAVNRLSEGLNRTRVFSQAVGAGDFNSPYEPLSEDDELGHALLSMRDELATTERELEMKVEQRTEEMSLQKQRAEELYEDLRDSINYALRIQKAILPTKKEIAEVFDKASVFYVPRDIVSGDFYYFRAVGRIRLLSAVDCTGHGVPGAFMSLVGYNALNHVTKVFTQPGRVLDQLNRAALEVLRPDSSAQHLQDGMDLVMLAIDMEKMELQFAGANNPLYIIRSGELTELKSDKFAIASFEPDSKSYTQHTFALEEGDTVFATTDGFVDQFGGPAGKKYMRRRFRELLIRISYMQIEDHKAEFEKVFTEWRGEEEQVDDVLVISIRI